MNDTKHESHEPSTDCAACRELQRDVDGIAAALERERASKAILLEACDLAQRAWAGDGVTMAEAVDACLLAIDEAKNLAGKRGVTSAAIKLTSTAAIRAACELSIAQGEHHAQVMYKSEYFEDHDYVGADLEEFAGAVNDPEELEKYCGGGRHSWELWVYEWPEEQTADASADGRVA